MWYGVQEMMWKVLKYKSDRAFPSRFRDGDCDMGMDILWHATHGQPFTQWIKFIQLVNLTRSKFGCFNSSIGLVQMFMFKNAKPVDFQRGCLVFRWKGCSLESLNLTLKETNVGAAWVSINGRCLGKGPTLVDWTWDTGGNRASKQNLYLEMHTVMKLADLTKFYQTERMDFGEF